MIENSNNGTIKGPAWTQDYYHLSHAAKLTGFTEAELLHLGVIGRIALIAPVVFAENFSWPEVSHLHNFPELLGPQSQRFDASDRVRLIPSDLARIEALGWVVPEFFYAPERARKALWGAYQSFEEAVRHRSDKYRETHEYFLQKRRDEIEALQKHIQLSAVDSERLEELVKLDIPYREKTNEEWQALREEGFNTLWQCDRTKPIYVKEPNFALPPRWTPLDDEKTKAHHLFLPHSELIGLIGKNANIEVSRSQKNSDEEKDTGNHSERHARNRLEVIHAAIYCKSEFPHLCEGSNQAWARAIHEKGYLFWKTGLPPYEIKGIANILGEFSRLPKEKYQGKPIKDASD